MIKLFYGFTLAVLVLALPVANLIQEHAYYKRYHDDFEFMLSQLDDHAWCIPMEFIKELK